MLDEVYKKSDNPTPAIKNLQDVIGALEKNASAVKTPVKETSPTLTTPLLGSGQDKIISSSESMSSVLSKTPQVTLKNPAPPKTPAATDKQKDLPVNKGKPMDSHI